MQHCPSMDCDYLSPPLPTIPFSSDDIRSKHQAEYYENKKTKFRAKLGSLDRNEHDAQLGLGVNAQKEQPINSNLTKNQNWTSRFKILASKIQSLAGKRLGIRNVNSSENA